MKNVIAEITKIGQEIEEIDIILENINKIGEVMSEQADKVFNLYIEECLQDADQPAMTKNITIPIGENEMYYVQGNAAQIPQIITSFFQSNFKPNIPAPLSLDLDLGNTVLLKILDVLKNEYSGKRKKLIKKLEKFGIKEI